MAGAATTLTPVEVYLRSSYRPDREFVDGEVLKRNLGEREHGAVQLALGRWFFQHRFEWNIYVVPELRIRVSPTRYRIPDVCVLSRDTPREPIPTRPPLVCIEILSPGDTVRRTLDRVADFRAMGVENNWIVDPASGDGFDCRPEGLLKTRLFAAVSGPVRLDLDALFADLD